MGKIKMPMMITKIKIPQGKAQKHHLGTKINTARKAQRALDHLLKKVMLIMPIKNKLQKHKMEETVTRTKIRLDTRENIYQENQETMKKRKHHLRKMRHMIKMGES